MKSEVLAIKKGRKWVAVTVDYDKAQVMANASQGGHNYVNGLGSSSIERLLQTSLSGWKTLKALAEDHRDPYTDEPTWKRAAEYDI